MTQPEREKRWTAVGWWSIWVLLFVVSLLPPIVHDWKRIPDIVEAHRYSWGPHFLPADLLLLRYLGEWSHWVPIALLIFLAMGIYRRTWRNGFIVSGALLTSIFSSIYATSCLIVISIYLVSSTDSGRKNQKIEQAESRQAAPDPYRNGPRN